MSYCRWSSDDYQCDVYVYPDSRGGWTTHVAGRRVIFGAPLPEPAPLPHPFTDAQFDAWADRHRKVQDMLDMAERVDIGLPHDGETFNDPTPGDCAERLQSLRNAGYNVPQYAVDALLEESLAVCGPLPERTQK